LSFRANARNLSRGFSVSMGERKLMDHFVVRTIILSFR
jgi:hypothetical protein